MLWRDDKYKGKQITPKLLIEIEHDVKMVINNFAQRVVNSSLAAYHDGSDIIIVAYNEETAQYLRRIAAESKPRVDIDSNNEGGLDVQDG